jgi:hypothetical protein
MMRGIAALALGLAWLPGCAPSTRYFIEHHAYGEAVCAAGSGEEDRAAARRFVAGAVVRDLAPSIYAHALTRAELEASVGEAGKRISERVLLLYVVSETRPASGIDALVEWSLSGAGVRAPAGSDNPPGTGVAVGRELLADLSRESLPRAYTVVDKPGVLDKVGAAASSPGGFFAGLGELLTLGLIPVTEITGVVKTRTTTVTPTDADYARQAPAAETLYQSLKGKRGNVLAFARPEGDDVKLHLRFDVRSVTGGCLLDMEADVALPPGGSIEDRVNRRFAEGRMTRLSELGEVTARERR